MILLWSLVFLAASTLLAPAGFADAAESDAPEADKKAEKGLGAQADKEDEPRAESDPNAPSIEGRAELGDGRASIRLANPAQPFAIRAIELSAEAQALPRSVRLIPSINSIRGEPITIEIARGDKALTHRFDPPIEAEALELELEKPSAQPIRVRMITSASAERLIDALERGGSWRLRARALLPALGSAAIPSLEARFEGADERTRRDLIAVYGKLSRDRRAAERLLQLSVGDDASLAALAAEALPPPLLAEAVRRGSRPAMRLASRSQPAIVLPALLEALKQAGEQPSVDLSEIRSALAGVTRALGEEAPGSLAAALGDRGAIIRARSLPAFAAFPALKGLIEREIGALSEGLEDDAERIDEEADEGARFEIRYRTLEALTRIEEPVSDELIELALRATGAEEWMLRALAYEALSAHRGDDPILLPTLLAAFDDAYPRVRLLAASRLTGLPSESALPKLREAASDPFPMVREGAVRAAHLRGEALGTPRDPAGNVRLAVYERMADSPDEERGLKRALKREAHPKVLAAFLSGAIVRCDGRFNELAERLVVTADMRDDESAHAGKSGLAYLLAFEGSARDAWLKELEQRGARSADDAPPIRCPR